MHPTEQPDLDAIEARFVALTEGRLSRDEADRWAARWVADDGLDWDEHAWWALNLLFGIDLPAGPDGGYLHDDEQVRDWLHELRRRRMVAIERPAGQGDSMAGPRSAAASRGPATPCGSGPQLPTGKERT